MIIIIIIAGQFGGAHRIDLGARHEGPVPKAPNRTTKQAYRRVGRAEGLGSGEGAVGVSEYNPALQPPAKNKKKHLYICILVTNNQQLYSNQPRPLGQHVLECSRNDPQNNQMHSLMVESRFPKTTMCIICFKENWNSALYALFRLFLHFCEQPYCEEQVYINERDKLFIHKKGRCVSLNYWIASLVWADNRGLNHRPTCWACSGITVITSSSPCWPWAGVLACHYRPSASRQPSFVSATSRLKFLIVRSLM